MADIELERQMAIREMNDREALEKALAKKLFDLQLSNLEKLKEAQIDQINAAASYKIKKEQQVNERLIKMGFNVASVLSKQTLDERLKAIDDDAEAKMKKIRGRGAKDKKQQIRAEAELQKQEEIKLENEKQKIRNKNIKKEAEDRFKANQKYFDNLGNALFSPSRFKKAVEELTEYYESEDGGSLKPDEAKKKAESEAKKDRAVAAADAAEKALAGFAKQLESSINDIAYAKSAIDTRLQGSNNKTIFGSYWERMSLDVVENVGMNPFIKQSDVVTNIKKLVGDGISFNVEQRAFLETIKDKIATTFDATDAALIKLVRIQQADTTAARLGMESALTEFLNSMYETTEYMQDAAKEIRSNLYEASALMGATQATAFEYQVQKWMGSLYSVGFNNTSGISSALGKLAAGDISGVTEGGAGNLLIMAANRANLSIAKILADGLDDSETNLLMQKMVEYLQEIYSETRNSRVVAQQYAGVFGLTASDLKAAANLYGSTNAISKHNLGYGGMIGRLQTMAGSMYKRTSTGEMLTNVFDNFKYSLANSIGNNPVLYSLYTLAGMLDDVAGGIAIPSITAMASGFDLETTVADLIRVSTVGTAILPAIGTLIAGLTKGGGINPLKAFGIGNSLTTLTRGAGTGISSMPGASISESGLVANSDSSDIQNQTMQSANEESSNKVAEAQDESTETKLSTVDEHIMNIYDLLSDVVSGASSLHVDMGNVSAWADVMGGH